MARNPFRSEAEAFRFLLLTVGYFALIVVAAAITTWLGVVVFLVLTAAAVVAVARGRARTSRCSGRRWRGEAENERRILVVANETVGGEELLAILRSKAEGSSDERARRLPRAQLAGADVDLGRGRRAGGGAGAARREPRAARA